MFTEPHSVLAGVALVIWVTAVAIKKSGPELRCWAQMFWARRDAVYERKRRIRSG